MMWWYWDEEVFGCVYKGKILDDIECEWKWWFFCCMYLCILCSWSSVCELCLNIVVIWGLVWIWFIYIFFYYLVIDRCGYDDGNMYWSVINESKIYCISIEWKKLFMNNDIKRENNWLDRELKLVLVIVYLSKSRKVKWKVNNIKYIVFVGYIFFIILENLMIVFFVMIL